MGRQNFIIYNMARNESFSPASIECSPDLNGTIRDVAMDALAILLGRFEGRPSDSPIHGTWKPSDVILLLGDGGEVYRLWRSETDVKPKEKGAKCFWSSFRYIPTQLLWVDARQDGDTKFTCSDCSNEFFAVDVSCPECGGHPFGPENRPAGIDDLLVEACMMDPDFRKEIMGRRDAMREFEAAKK